MDPLELLTGKMAVYSQPVLTFHGSVRKPDVVIVTDHGDVVIVEVKRLVNAELRDGRRAIAQGVEYASLLSSAPEAELVRSLTGGQHSSWDLLCRHDLGQDASPSQVANVLRNRIGDGDIHLVIACEQAPPDLGALVRAAANSARLAFALHVVEVRPMVPDATTEAQGQIAWVPWPRLDTEIVHRTAVTVRVQGAEGANAPSINVNIRDDSGPNVEEKDHHLKPFGPEARATVGGATGSHPTRRSPRPHGRATLGRARRNERGRGRRGLDGSE